MDSLKQRLIGTGLATLGATGLHRMLAPLTRGSGVILTFHHVRPWEPQSFAPNRGLEITPEHLDAVIGHVRNAGYRIVPLDDVLPRLAAGDRERFAVLTFDDGLRDTAVHALPVLERHEAPFTVFVTTGFADRTARLWWIELERLIRTTSTVRGMIRGREQAFAVADETGKRRAFSRLSRSMALLPGPDVAEILANLGCSAAAGRQLVGDLCLSWVELADLAHHPLVTIGCHTATHPGLASLDAEGLGRELAGSRDDLASRLGQPVRHLAYPYGFSAAAGPREYAAAAALGFVTAVTTRPGVLRPNSLSRPTALPRVSVNGLWPSLAALDVLLSGAPFVWPGF